MRPIVDVAADLGLAAADLRVYGDDMAKLRLPALPPPGARLPGRIVLVSAINPTPGGEGKTTVSIGLAQGLRRLGERVALALREPSLGPVFGLKGGGTGGGRCRLEPSARIDLHFTGDLHAVGAAHNLLAALVDNAVHHHAGLDLEHRQVFWRRVLDVNDRALRHTVIGLGGRLNGVPREDGFDITAASEVMAILCLHDGIADLKARLGRILVGFDRAGEPVTAADLQAHGAMAALLQDALLPNLVQTSEGVPALVHGGPFGNIAHGCNSVVATRAAAARADYVVTEAGFGFDLGAEKFFDLKCRSAGLWPRAVVLVVTARALCVHGGGAHCPGGAVETLQRGLEHLDQHVASVRAHHLRRRRGRGRARRAPGPRAHQPARLRPPAGVHRQDPPVALRRPAPDRPAARLPAAARVAAHRRRRRLPAGADRRHRHHAGTAAGPGHDLEVPLQCRVHLAPVDHDTLPGLVLHLLQREGVADHVPGELAAPLRVLRTDSNRVVDREPRVFPGQQLGGELGRDRLVIH